jgi:hypothetical protein
MLPTLVPGVPEYFLTDEGVARQQRVTRRWIAADLSSGPTITPDQPWESRTLSSPSVVRDGEAYRLYYGDWPGAHGPHLLMMAMSDDGLRWEKPELGLVEWHGSTHNNIVYSAEGTLESPNVVRIPGDPTPYRMINFGAGDVANWLGPDNDGPDWGLHTYRSGDGLRWTKDEGGLRLRAGDRNTLLVTSAGEYVSLNRHREMFEQTGARAVYRSTSSDFASWSAPELILAPDLEDEPDVELYGMTAFERHGWFWGLLEVWHGATDMMEIQLAFSRNGSDWIRPAIRTPFVPLGPWNSRYNWGATGNPLLVEDQMVFIINGRTVAHDWNAARQDGSIGFASLALDRFCAIEGWRDGMVETVPLVWPGGDLVINADTRHSYRAHPYDWAGSDVRVEVCDPTGNPIQGWSAGDAAIYRGNTVSRGVVRDGAVRWQERSLDAMRGQSIRLRFHLTHARLYTYAAEAA